MKAGKLRHRVDIDKKSVTRNALGEEIVTWKIFAERVPAEISPLSAREFITAQRLVGSATARIVIRWRQGVNETMRIRHNDDIYDIQGVLPDVNSGREYITLPVSRGLKD